MTRLAATAADGVLRAVRRRLRREQVLHAVRVSAGLTIAVALGAALLHVFVRPLAFGSVVALSTGAWILLTARAAAARLTRTECAAWADWRLGAESAYSTFLEASANARAATAARARLEDWIEGIAPTSLERLRALPLRPRLREPLAVAMVSVALCGVLLQIPVLRGGNYAVAAGDRRGAPAADSAAGLGQALDVDATAPSGTSAGGESSGPTVRARVSERTLQPAADAAGADEREAGTNAGIAASAGRASTGGRDAGLSADTSADAGLSEAWQGALASSLHALDAAASDASRADPDADAQFTADSGDGHRLPTALTAVRAATPPEAGISRRLGPAEAAYVRAYFADSGVTE